MCHSVPSLRIYSFQVGGKKGTEFAFSTKEPTNFISFIDTFITYSTIFKVKKTLRSKHDADNITCAIPQLDPFDKSFLKYISHPKNFNCKKIQPELTYIDENGRLTINMTEKRAYAAFKNMKCRWRTLEKGYGNKNAIEKGKYIPLFEYHPVAFPRHDIVEVYCNTSNNHYYNIHGFPHRIESLTPPNEDQLSVVVLYLESTSSSRVLRHLRKTFTYLARTMKSVVFNGFNKVADNTFVNMIPAVTGRRSGYQQWNMKDEFKGFHINKEYFDEVPFFIWKNFSKIGYKTSYVEDTPDLGTFEYNKKGFKEKKPFDFYYRPLFLRLRKLRKLSTRFCFGNNPIMKLQLDLMKNMLLKYGNTQRLFAIDFHCEISHDSENDIERVDDIMKNHLKVLYETGSLNKTIFFILGDHGARYGAVRNTNTGYFEERMPFLAVKIPKWFLKKHKHIRKAIKINSKRLITPFDLHETFKDILNSNYKGKQRKYNTRGLSLFYNIPSNRTCEMAGVPERYCICSRFTEVSIYLENVKNAAQYLVLHLNNLLKPHSKLCHMLKLKKIINAGEMMLLSNRDIRKYRVLIQTMPGGALIETLVTYYVVRNTFEVKDGISRLNLYGRQSHCVKNKKLICYCKKLL